jgi:hypothetical protein
MGRFSPRAVCRRIGETDPPDAWSHLMRTTLTTKLFTAADRTRRTERPTTRPELPSYNLNVFALR